MAQLLPRRPCARAFDRQFGRNQAFNAAGNVTTALLIAYCSYRFGYRAIFLVAIAMVLPALLSMLAIDSSQIDYAQARGGREEGGQDPPQGLGAPIKDRGLIWFLLAAFLFHLSNAAMLPQLGEMLSKSDPKAAAPFMSACIIVTQLVISISAIRLGKRAAISGRKPLLLVGFGVLPVRGVLYTLVHGTTALIAVQLLDGVANAIFGIVSILVIKDITNGTGRFNMASGALATVVGIGGALSNALGGTLIQLLGYGKSFLALAAVAVLAVGVLRFAVPETLPDHRSPGRVRLAS